MRLAPLVRDSFLCDVCIINACIIQCDTICMKKAASCVHSMCTQIDNYNIEDCKTAHKPLKIQIRAITSCKWRRNWGMLTYDSIKCLKLDNTDTM